MRAMRLVACVAIFACVATTAFASNWTGGAGDWDLVGNWDAGVPNGTNAYIGNGGTPTLDSLVNNINELDVAWFSGLNIQNGAGLTAIGDARVAGGGNDLSSVTQTGGVVSLQSNLTLGNGGGDIATWTMTANGSLAVGSDLVVGGAGQGTFQVQDNSTLTVGGRIDIAKLTGGSGGMTVSGGTVGQLAGGGDPAILADMAVNETGSFRVEGDAAVINVATYSQGSGATLEAEFNNTGISTIRVDGNVNIAGILRGSIAGSPPSGEYDLIVSETGTVSGQFSSLILDHSMQVRYELNDEGKNAVRLYVDTEAPELPIQGQLPDTYDKIISMNIKGAADPDINEYAELGSNAGVVAAKNWNNLVYTGGNSYGPGVLVDNSGAAAVSMSLSQSGADYRNAAVIGDPTDPNLNLYKSQAPTTAWNNPGGLAPPHDAYMTAVADTTLTGLQAEFPYGYDVIVNVAQWTFTASSTDRHEYVEFWDGAGTQITTGEGNTNGGVYDASLGLEMDVGNPGYSAGTGFVDGVNYVIYRNLTWDTLELRPRPDRPVNQGFSQNMQITGVQILGHAPNQLPQQEFIVDNLDQDNSKPGHIEREWVWYERGTVDEWENSSYYSLNNADSDPGTPGHQGIWFRWHTPTLLFEEPTPYEVFVWIASERPSGGYYNSDSMAKYTIYAADGPHEVIFDQNTASGTWVSLGEYLFTASGLNEYVQLERTLSATGTTSADAIKWVWTQPFVEVGVVPEPTGLGLIGFALLAVRKRRS